MTYCIIKLLSFHCYVNVDDIVIQNFSIQIANRMFNVIILGAGVYLSYHLLNQLILSNAKMLKKFKIKPVGHRLLNVFGLKNHLTQSVFYSASNPKVTFNMWNLSSSNKSKHSNSSECHNESSAQSSDAKTFNYEVFDDEDLVPDLVLSDLTSPDKETFSLEDYENKFMYFVPNQSSSSSSSTLTRHDLDIAETNYSNLTIDKIDHVLSQIDDIKKSIVEIDSHLFLTESKLANFNPNFFTLTNTDLDYDELNPHSYLPIRKSSSTLSLYSSSKTDITKSDDFLKIVNPDYHLEWDDLGWNDDNTQDDIEEGFFFDDPVKTDYYQDEYEQNYHTDIDKFDGMTNAMSQLPVTDYEKQKLMSLKDLFEEAKQMGLLNIVIEALCNKKE